MNRDRSARPPAKRHALLRVIVRTLLLLAVLALAARLTAQLLFGLIQPHITVHRLAREVAQLEQMKTAKQKEKQALLDKIRWWSSPMGEDELAHEKGLVRPGEHTVLIPTPSAANPAPPPMHAIGSVLGEQTNPTFLLFLLAFLACSLVYLGLLLRRRHLIRVRRPEGTLTPRSELARRR